MAVEPRRTAKGMLLRTVSVCLCYERRMQDNEPTKSIGLAGASCSNNPNAFGWLQYVN